MFKRNQDSKIPGMTVRETFGLRKTSGQVGLEIEVEGRSLLHFEMLKTKGWVYHEDGSLRGEENAEYVLHRPVTFAAVDERIDALFDDLAKNKAKFDDSNRTSVHVHLNVQEFYLNRLTNLMALYFIFEDFLTEWCGEYRVGNLFCLRSRDATELLVGLTDMIRSNLVNNGIHDGMKYCGLNPYALFRYGSLEFRTMRGVTDPEVIKTWVGILRKLYEKSADNEDPRELCAFFSQDGPSAFFDEVLGEYSAVLRGDLNLTEEGLRKTMYEGVRRAQDLCYAIDWNRLEKVQNVTDPFGRKSAKSATPTGGFAPSQFIEEALSIDNHQWGLINQAFLGGGPE